MGTPATELNPAWLCSNKTTLPAIGHPLWNSVNTYITECLTMGQTVLLWLSNASVNLAGIPGKSLVSSETARFRPQAAFSPKMRDRRILKDDVFSGFLCLDEDGSPVQACLRGVLFHGRNEQDGIHF